MAGEKSSQPLRIGENDRGGRLEGGWEWMQKGRKREREGAGEEGKEK